MTVPSAQRRPVRHRYLASKVAGPLLSPEQLKELSEQRSHAAQIRKLIRFAGQQSIKSPVRRHMTMEHLSAARRHTLELFVRRATALRLDVRNLRWTSIGSICTVATSWLADGMPHSTLRTLISHMNWLLRALGHDVAVSASELIAARSAPNESHEVTPLEAPSTPTREQVEAALAAAEAIDRRIGLMLQLIYRLQARPGKVLALRPHAMFEAGAVVLSRGGRYKPTHIVVPSPAATVLIERALAMTSRQHDSLLRRGEKPEVARQRLYRIASKVGLCRAGLGVTPDDLARFARPAPTTSVPAGSATRLGVTADDAIPESCA